MRANFSAEYFAFFTIFAQNPVACAELPHSCLPLDSSAFQPITPRFPSMQKRSPPHSIWYDLAPHLLDQAVNLFGLPVSMTVDLAQLRPGAQTTDYFHAVLSYPQRRIVLHGTMVAAAESARYIIHGTRGSYVKFGLDPQEDRLKNGERLPQEDWGYDMRDGVVTRVEGEELVEETLLTIPGNYPAYYAAIRDALNGTGENPVPASQAIQIMELIELGIESAKHRATLCLA